MKFPELNVIKKNTEVINELMGHDHRNVISDGYFYDTLNMSNDSYPTIRTRDTFKKKEVTDSGTSYDAIQLVVADSLYSVRVVKNVANYSLYVYNEETGEQEASTTYNAESDRKLRVAGMSNKIVIYPAKIVYDCINHSFEDIGVRWDPGYNSDVYEFDDIYMSSDQVSSTIAEGKRYLASDYFATGPSGEGSDNSALYERLETIRKKKYDGEYELDIDLDYSELKFYGLVEGSISDINSNDDLYIDYGTHSYVTGWRYRHGYKVTRDVENERLGSIIKGKLTVLDTSDGKSPIFMKVQMVDSNGNPITEYTESSTAPSDPEDGDYWLDTSKTVSVIKIYSASTQQWSQVISASYQISLDSRGIGYLPSGFNEEDTVNFVTSNDELSGSWEIKSIADDRSYFTIEATLSKFKYIFYNDFFVERSCPDIDYLCVCDNRVWGCSSSANELYASALGDPFNWEMANDSAEDSYSLKVASDGDFTACVNYNGQIVFMKQDTIHIIYGTKPQNYSIKTLVNVEGISNGAADSAAIIGGVLYYKGVHGVYAYDGSYPTLISDPFGDELYTGGSAGGYKSKYIIFMSEASYIYDAAHSTWQKISTSDVESNVLAHNTDAFFFTLEDDKYYLNSLEQGEDGYITEENLEWELETGDLALAYTNHKWISKVIIRAEIASEATFNVAVSYDDSDFDLIHTITGKKNLNIINLPIVSRRCDHMRFRFYGTGNVRIYAISKDIETGSEI